MLFNLGINCEVKELIHQWISLKVAQLTQLKPLSVTRNLKDFMDHSKKGQCIPGLEAVNLGLRGLL